LVSSQNFFLTSKASPNDSKIVIIVIIIVIGEAMSVVHIGGIIAQTFYLGCLFVAHTPDQPSVQEICQKTARRAKSRR